MSTVIDQRVVEMRFDNKQFERNVSTTMSTLEKLKQKLNFKDASKGLDGVSAAAKNVDMNGLAAGVDAVRMKFSALDVFAVTALTNIANSAFNAGKKIVSALTIDPIKSGLSEYETKMGSIQTILANTQHEGTNLDDVTAALEELNLYADKTIYNFQEMTRNIGTFTAAGVDLDTSVASIKGIANLAAVSGSTSQQASTAMYQLSQALAAGKVSLMDWNSVVNAGMGGKVFQDALIRTSELLDTGANKAIKTAGSFRESLTKSGWLTTEVLTETLKQLSGAYTEAELISQGFTESQAKEIAQLAQTASDAATKVKTFTQLFDTLKESAQSGWAQTWELIFGDFEEAKEFFTDLSSMLGGLIESMSGYRNNLLGNALDSNWDRLAGKIAEAGRTTSEYEEAVRSAWKANGKTSESLDDLVKKHGSLEKVIREGKIPAEILKDALADLGIVSSKTGEGFSGLLDALKKIDRLLGWGSTGDDVKTLQTALEELGYSVGKCKIDGIIGPDTTKAIKEFQEAAGIAVDGIAGPETLAALEKAGLEFDELSKNADETAESYDDLINSISKKGGRELLLEGFKNIINGLVGTLRALGRAWAEIFPADNMSSGLFKALEGFSKFTESLRLFNEEVDENGDTIIKFTENGEKLIRVFKGIFAIVDIVTTIIGGGLKIAFKVITGVLGKFDLHILDVAASIGDVLVGVRDFIDGMLNISGIVEYLVPLAKNAAEFIKELVKTVKNSKWFADFCNYVNRTADGLGRLFKNIPNTEAFENLISILKKGAKYVREWVQSLKESENIPGDIIAGLVKGIVKGVPAVLSAIGQLAMSIITGICDILGIHSPSTVMITIGGFIIAGLVKGILDGETTLVGSIGSLADVIWDAMKTVFGILRDNLSGIFTGLWNFIADENGNVQWGKIFAGGMVGGMIWTVMQFAKAFKGLADGIGGISDLLEEAGDTVKRFGKVLSSYSWDLKAKALQRLAISIAILVAAIWVLTQIDDVGKMWNAVAIIAVLGGVLIGLAFALDKMSSAGASFDLKNGLKLEGLKQGLLQIGVALLLMAVIVKMIGSMDPEEAKQGFLGLAGMAAGMLVFMWALGKLTAGSEHIDKVGNLMKKLAVAMLLMVVVIKLVDMLDAGEIFKGIVFGAAFAVFVRSITKIAKDSGEHVGKVGGLVLKVAFAMLLMIGVCKLAGSLRLGEMIKGAAFAYAFIVFTRALVLCSKLNDGKEIAKLGGLVASVAFSMLLMIGVCKLAARLKLGEVIKGAAFAAGFIVLLKFLVETLTIGNDKKIAQVAGTIMAMSAAIAIMAGVAILLGLVDIGGLAKGIIAVGMLSLMMMGMIKSLKGVKNAHNAIMMMAISIAVMAAAIIALCHIKDTSKLMTATASIAIVMGMFALIEKNSRGIKKAAGPIAILVAAVGALALILFLLTKGISDPVTAIAAATSIGILLGALTLSLKMVSGVTSVSKSALVAMGVMTLIVGGLAIILGLLTALDVAPSVETATALSILLLAMAGVTAVLTLIGGGAPAVLGGLGAFAAVVVGVGALMVALAGLNKLFPKLQDWLDTGIAILEKIGEGIGKFIAGFLGGIGEGLMDSLSDMVDTFGRIVTKLAVISKVGKFIDPAGFDGVLKLIEILGDIAALTVGTTISDIFTLGGSSMDKFQTDGVAFFKAMGAIAEASKDVVVNEDGMGTIIGIAEDLVTLQKSLEPIGGVISWFTGRDDLGTFGDNVAEFMGSMVTALSGLSDFSCNEDALGAIITSAEDLAKLQSSLEPIGGVVSWFTGRDDLGSFGMNVGYFIASMQTALGQLNGSAINSEGLDLIIDAAKRLSELQSSLEPIGGVISWFTGRDDLGTFGVNVGEFISSMKTALGTLDAVSFNSEALDIIIEASVRLSALQSSLEPIGGVISWFTGRDDLGTFGDNVAEFINSMKTAMVTLDGVTFNEEAMESVIKAAEDLAELQSSLEPIGGVISWFTGREDLGTFGDNVKIFAEAMGALKTNMGEDGITQSVVDSVTYAGEAILELEKALPEEGWFDGKMNLSEFSDYISDFATAIGTFATTSAQTDFTAINTAITAGYRIRNLINDLVGLDTSGLVTFTGVGTGGIGADGAAYNIAQAIKAYSDEVAGINVEAVNVSVTAAAMLRNLIANLVGLDTSGLENFKIDSIGTAMKTYGESVKDIDTGIVSQSVSSANRLRNFISSLAGLDASGISNFKPSSIGLALKGYSGSISGVSLLAVTQSVAAATKLRNFISSLSGLDTSGAGSFKTALDKLSKVDIYDFAESFSRAAGKLSKSGSKMMEGLINGITGKTSDVRKAISKLLTAIDEDITNKMSAFTKAGGELMSKLADGVDKKKKAVTSAVKAIVTSAASSIKDSYDSFYDAGRYLVSGFASGISANSYKASAKAVAMANAAAKAAKEALKINSPSKVFMAIGSGIPEGFAMGIEKMSGLINAPLNTMANGAIKSVSDTVSRIAAAIDSDMDVQPTIRPVLDLSDIRSGAGSIGDMLGFGTSVGVMANVGAISRSMSTMSQNGGNSDVVSAINDLRKDLGNVGNTSYTISGITYDDGSNIASAVKDIARYARMERRV